MGTHTDNKTGDDLKAQRFQMLEDIAKELSGEVVFPTYFDAVLRLRKVLQDPNETIGGIATAVSLEPLISAKLLQIDPDNVRALANLYKLPVQTGS